MGEDKNGVNPYRPNLYGMIQTIIVTSIDKGQAIIGFIGMISLILVFKLTPEQSYDLLQELISMVKNTYYLGWFLFVLITFISVFFNKFQRKVHERKIEKMTSRTKKLEELLTQQELPTSKKDS